jgi:hypothetical protein
MGRQPPTQRRKPTIIRYCQRTTVKQWHQQWIRFNFQHEAGGVPLRGAIRKLNLTLFLLYIELAPFLPIE